MTCSSGLAVVMALLLQEFRKVKPFEREPQEPREPSPPIIQESDLTEAEVRALSRPESSHPISRPDIGMCRGILFTTGF